MIARERKLISCNNKKSEQIKINKKLIKNNNSSSNSSISVKLSIAIILRKMAQSKIKCENSKPSNELKMSLYCDETKSF